ncbi:DEA(D/H)-box RNA helicase family protein isoform 1 [Hibiscus syriacus]|uniref:DEA(D/H)-box RNA helicase family protein isoform 1 n=1 Tax=Hibiscus syriacus TaxID=106335 RepID=A0A6A3B9H5_HIBSY|nr:uncharacterized protein LOC120219507 [Hibiscus syriacus]KAE8713684.1 DEA(D/H)-box RNA helicase family protein isoform 1 [Hibiscus syriacus]
MGFKNRVEEKNCSMNEALLFATMSIIGLQVDAHLKDSSVYSGIFHTASVEKEYGIVLKKAKLTKKGRCATNVPNGSVVETLVILAGDLVQVVAKGVPLPFDGFAGNIDCGNGEAASEFVPSSNPLNGTKKLNESTMDERKRNTKRISAHNENGFADSFISTDTGKEDEGRKLLENPMGNGKEVEHQKRDETHVEQREGASGATVARRQVGEDRSLLSQDELGQKFEFHVEQNEKEVQQSVSSCESSAVDTLKPVVGEHDNPCCERPSAIDIHQDAVCSGVSTSNLVKNVSPESCQRLFANPTAIIPPQSSELNKNSKEFKLNPGAKVFSPSFATAISAAPPIVPTVTNVPYIPGNSPMVAVAGSQPEDGMGTFVPRSSTPSKFVSYGNISAATGVNGSQFSQPIVGHMGNRTQPLRYAGQYHPDQAATAYLNPNSQAVMFGHLGQLICMPVSHDLVPSAAGLSPEPARPLLTPHHVQFPKHQGSAPDQALPLCVPQPFIAGGQPPLAVPSHIPYLHAPFPVNRPVQFPGSNGLFSTKLP